MALAAFLTAALGPISEIFTAKTKADAEKAKAKSQAKIDQINANVKLAGFQADASIAAVNAAAAAQIAASTGQLPGQFGATGLSQNQLLIGGGIALVIVLALVLRGGK